MAGQIQGLSGSTWDNSNGLMRAMRYEVRPLDHGALGQYRKSVIPATQYSWASGIGTVNIASFRWTDATRFCAIKKVTLDGASTGTTVLSGADFQAIRLYPARSFSADTTGGSSGTFTGNTGKMRTSMGTSLAGSLNFASSTTAVTGGTFTADTDPIGQYCFTTAGAVSTTSAGDAELLTEYLDGEYPLVLAQNEGFIVTFTTASTSGSLLYGLTVVWAELASY